MREIPLCYCFVLRSRDCTLGKPRPKEVHQLKVDLVRMGPGYAMRSIFHHYKAGSLDQLGSPMSGRGDGQNAVRIAVKDQSGHVDMGEVFAEVLMPGGHASETRRSRGSGCEVPTRLNSLFADALTQ